MKVSTIVRVMGMLALAVVMLSMASAVSANSANPLSVHSSSLGKFVATCPSGYVRLPTNTDYTEYLATHPGAIQVGQTVDSDNDPVCFLFATSSPPAPSGPVTHTYDPLTFGTSSTPPLTINPGPASNPAGGSPTNYYNDGVTVPGAAVPSGQSYLAEAWTPAPNGLPIGDGGIAFRGPGGSLVAFRIWDTNSNMTIHSLNAPGVKVCFTYPDNIQFDPTYGEAMQYYAGNSSNPWITLPGPYTRTSPAGGWVALCTQVTSF